MSPSIKIYVGNIPGLARNSELKELFEKFGKVVECDILKDFGFVHMEDTNDAKAAIAGLNDTLWKGSRIRVELSTTKTSKGEPSMRYREPPGDYLGGYRRPPPPHHMMPPHRELPPYGMPPHRIPRDVEGGPIRHDRYGPPPPLVDRYAMERGRPYPPEFDRRVGIPPPPLRGDYPPYVRNGAPIDMRNGSADRLGPGGGGGAAMDMMYMRGPPRPGMGPPPQAMHHHEEFYRGGPPPGPPSMSR